METLVRIIFRLDFPLNYEIVNRPGDLMRIIQDLKGAQWTGSTEAQARRQYAAYRVSVEDEKEYEDLVADTRSISGNHEWRPGVPVGASDAMNYLDLASEACAALKSQFGIEEITRIGVRMFVVGEPVPDYKASRQHFNDRFSNKFLGRASDTLVPDDAAMIIEGTVQDDVKYRIQAGPGSAQDLVRFHDKLNFDLKEFENLEMRLFAADVDIYEENISLKGTSLHRWFRQKIPAFETLISQAKLSVRSDAN